MVHSTFFASKCEYHIVIMTHETVRLIERFDIIELLACRKLLSMSGNIS